MKKLFAFVFASLLAVGAYAYTDLLDGISLEKIDLVIPDNRFPDSNRSHEDNMINMTVNLRLVDTAGLPVFGTPEERYWANSIEWEEWTAAHPANYDENDEAAEERYGQAVNQFVREYEAELEKEKKEDRKKFDNRLKEWESATTECKMVRISSYWLVGSASCLPAYIRNNPKINSEKADDIAWEIFNESRKYRYAYFINSINIDGVYVLPIKNMFIGNGLILIHLTNTEVAGMDHLSTHKVNVLTPVSSIGVSKVYVGNEEVAYSKLNSKKALSGTPVFLEDQDFREYLYAFNAAPYELKGVSNKFKETKSREYTVITQDMQTFIINTVTTVAPKELKEVQESK